MIDNASSSYVGGLSPNGHFWLAKVPRISRSSRWLSWSRAPFTWRRFFCGKIKCGVGGYFQIRGRFHMAYIDKCLIGVFLSCWVWRVIRTGGASLTEWMVSFFLVCFLLLLLYLPGWLHFRGYEKELILFLTNLEDAPISDERTAFSRNT